MSCSVFLLKSWWIICIALNTYNKNTPRTNSLYVWTYLIKHRLILTLLFYSVTLIENCDCLKKKESTNPLLYYLSLVSTFKQLHSATIKIFESNHFYAVKFVGNSEKVVNLAWKCEQPHLPPRRSPNLQMAPPPQRSLEKSQKIGSFSIMLGG